MEQDLKDEVSSGAYAELARENARLASALAALTPDVPGAEPPRGPANARTTLAAVQFERDELRAQVERLREKSEQKQLEIAAVVAKADALQAEAVELSEIIAGTRGSLSWRVTAPLRAFKALGSRRSG
jgi:chromosome segregation ATPase